MSDNILILTNAQNGSELKINLNSIKNVEAHSKGVYKVWVSDKRFHLVFQDERLGPYIKPIIQPSLFGSEDYTEAIKARDAGMKKVLKSANESDPKWAEKALKVFRNYVNLLPEGQEFLTEDVRNYAETNSLLPAPPSNKSWGPLTMILAKEGFIRKLGFRSVKNPKAHMAPVSVWVKNL